MHYHAQIWLEKDPGDNLENVIDTIMSPYQEGYGTGGDGFWDWYEIDGRWNHLNEKGIIPLSDASPELECYTLIIEDGSCYHNQLWTGDIHIPNPSFDGMVFPKLKQLGINEGYLVTVDYHC